MSEDRSWLRDPIYLERQRVFLAECRERVTALDDWFREAHIRIARLEAELERERTRELGHYEPLDEPL